MENLTPDTQPISDQAAEETPPPTQTIPAAQLAANRSNFKRSTGPRIPQGKLRSASNSMKHGLYSLRTGHPNRCRPRYPLSLPWLNSCGNPIISPPAYQPKYGTYDEQRPKPAEEKVKNEPNSRLLSTHGSMTKPRRASSWSSFRQSRHVFAQTTIFA